MRIIALMGLMALVSAAPCAAQTPISLTFDGQRASGHVQLGLFSAELTIDFEQVTGLGPSGLTASAVLLTFPDLALLERLPNQVGIPLGFPVLVHITAPAEGGLSFRGVTSVSLYTHNLTYPPGSRLVLYSAHQGGLFRDITRTASAGSYRVSGSSGTFSEFLIVTDLRPRQFVIAGKYDALQQTLDAHAAALPPDVVADLQTRLTDSKNAWLAGDTDGAIAALDGFTLAVQAGSGTTIPDVWNADGSLVNIAGLLRAGADTLRFSLSWTPGPP